MGLGVEDRGFLPERALDAEDWDGEGGVGEGLRKRFGEVGRERLRRDGPAVGARTALDLYHRADVAGGGPLVEDGRVREEQGLRVVGRNIE